MKNILLSVVLGCLMVSSLALASFEERFDKDVRDRVVQAANSICGDTWCGGDYDILFTNFNCAKLFAPACQLSFAYWLHDQPRYKTSGGCTLQNIYSAEDLFDNRPWGQTLSEKAYEQISDCLERIL